LGNVSYHENMTFTTRSRATVEAIILEAREMAFPEHNTDIEIWVGEGWRWAPAGKRAIRPFDSVVLDGDIANTLLADARKFTESRAWYRAHSVPYQRGYLLEGPPGNGKTSLTLAIAGALGKDLYVLRVADSSGSAFNHIMTTLPEHAVVLIEDVDCVFKERKNEQRSDGITFSEFLNGLDGATSPEGRILFLTTNHPEVLDQALVRPGRIDKRFHLGNATTKQAIKLYRRFFPNLHGDQAGYPELFGTAVHNSPKELSMAQLQEHILSHADDPLAAAGKP